MSTAVPGAARRALLFAALAWALSASLLALVVGGLAPAGHDLVAADVSLRATAVARGGLERAQTGAEGPPPELVLPRRVTLPLETPAGTVYYFATLDVLATYYTPRDGGKEPERSDYGLTATGARATRGVVAVDSRVIPLFTWLYVPGYGIAQALDVGGGIIGNHIDVAFDDGDGAWWGRRSLTVFVLAR